VQRLTVKTAVAETTELGHFAAIAAAYSTDRQGDRIVPGAFGLTIARWQGSGKHVPLHWNHGSKAEDVIGSVDPETMIEVEAGLFVEGDLDIHDSDVARQAWRSVKKNRVGLSFGYLTTDRPRRSRRDQGAGRARPVRDHAHADAGERGHPRPRDEVDRRRPGPSV
jgi:HK97 family phage prohead protease